MPAHLLIIDGLLLTRCTTSAQTPATLHDMMQSVQLAQSPRQSEVLMGIADMNCFLVQRSRLKYSAIRIPSSTVYKDTKAARDPPIDRVPFISCVTAALQMCQPNHLASRCARC